VQYRIGMLVARLFFRGIYFPQMNSWAWIKLVAQNGGSIFNLTRETFSLWHKSRRRVRTAPPASAQY
jgi:hypothetical protein